MKSTCIPISFTEPVKFIILKYNVSPTLKLAFCNVELDTQVPADVTDKLDANNVVAPVFLNAFMTKPVPASLNPQTKLAVQVNAALQATNEPVSVD